MPIAEADVDFYRDYGYLIVPDLVSPAEIEELKNDTTEIFRGKYDVPGIMKAQDGASETDVLRNYLCIHMPHKISEVQRSFIHHQGIADVLTKLIGPNVKCMQSMLFVKPPGFPGQAWHQDEYYIPTEDRSLTGAWIAMDDATIENGCLWVVPRSHKGDILPVGEQPPGDEYDEAGLMAQNVPAEKAVPCEATSGSVVFFNGYLLHESHKNRSDVYRRALVNHFMSAESRLKWCGEDDYRDIELVAGEDPYEQAGTKDISKPHLRQVSRKT